MLNANALHTLCRFLRFFHTQPTGWVLVELSGWFRWFSLRGWWWPLKTNCASFTTKEAPPQKQENRQENWLQEEGNINKFTLTHFPLFKKFTHNRQ